MMIFGGMVVKQIFGHLKLEMELYRYIVSPCAVEVFGQEAGCLRKHGKPAVGGRLLPGELSSPLTGNLEKNNPGGHAHVER